MSSRAKVGVLTAALTALVPATLVCEVPGLDELLENLAVEIYYEDGHDCRCGDCWSDWRYDGCGGGWFVDFDWW